jgi:hypothetical protein
VPLAPAPTTSTSLDDEGMASHRLGMSMLRTMPRINFLSTRDGACMRQLRRPSFRRTARRHVRQTPMLCYLRHHSDIATL